MEVESNEERRLRICESLLTMSRAGIEPAMHNLGREEKVNVYQPALNKVHRILCLSLKEGESMRSQKP